MYAGQECNGKAFCLQESVRITQTVVVVGGWKPQSRDRKKSSLAICVSLQQYHHKSGNYSDDRKPLEEPLQTSL